ncbi:CocE/NonD family hydrolase [Desertihabitans brevis]|uniref:CocE/NonD family hydrolase n=1 Tax=Desertihabitans brevis TaxID=2268447 RepID=A0A367YWK3_9ACTN|nr:CocE/NonD family hydrolase [Desertihabitans brevis]RCK70254.1 CocE/NonD family hydrolase [Desertihabitans brevis]
MNLRPLLPVLAGAVLVGATLVPAPATAAPIPTPDDPVTSEENPRVPEGAAWTEHYLPSTDGVELHADVLRPADLPADAQTPVILSVGPYFAHAGQTGDDGFEHTGPSERFFDLVEGADLMAEGYTFVMVDLRGFGGSTGCLDWVGPGEQADVEAAVEWAASQPWSNGRVGLYGKSYDASTGLVGANLEPEGLDAVVAQEPVWDMYNYLFSNGVRRPNHLGTPRAYNSIASIQGMADDSERYRANAAYERSHPECFADNLTDTQDPDEESAYWQARDLAAQAEGSQVPVFVTQGFIEPNTKPEDMQAYLENHDGEQRGWLGQWEHVRGNDRGPDGVLRMGREGWFEEVLRFYDEHLKDVEPEVEDPAFVVEDNTGRWRAEDTWPVVTRSTTVRLQRDDYVDDGGAGDARLAAAGADTAWDMEHAPDPVVQSRVARGPRTTEDADGYQTWSRPVRVDTRVTGTPRVLLDVEGSGNVLVRLWDVAPDGTAVMFDEQMSLVEDGSVAFDLKSTDWTLREGHQLAVGIGTNTSWSWADTPSGETITITRARLELDLQNTDDEPTDGARSPYLDDYLAAYTTTWDDRADGTFTLTVPPRG